MANKHIPDSRRLDPEWTAGDDGGCAGVIRPTDDSEHPLVTGGALLTARSSEWYGAP